mgnify:CR=1 FL=1
MLKKVKKHQINQKKLNQKSPLLIKIHHLNELKNQKNEKNVIFFQKVKKK